MRVTLTCEGRSLAPPTRRTLHRTHVHTHQSHARRRADSDALSRVRLACVEMQRERVRVSTARQARARRLARRPRRRRSTRIRPCPQGRARHERSVNAPRWGIRGKGCVGVPWRIWRVRGRKRGSVRLGVERWFERKHSHLRGRVNNHPDRSPFLELTRTNRPRIWPRRRLAASSAGSCAAVPGAGESIEYRRRHFFALPWPPNPSLIACKQFQSKRGHGVRHGKRKLDKFG